MESKEIESYRKELDKITSKIIQLVAERRKIVFKVGKIKKQKKLPIINIKREREILENSAKMAKGLKIDPTLIKKITKLLIEDARKIQKK